MHLKQYLLRNCYFGDQILRINEMKRDNWFEEWFDSKFYHLLYQHRDDAEAELFLGNMIEKISLRIGARIIDVGCGSGRHAKYLNEKGFIVDGIDLSSRNIKEASKFSNDNLQFHICDMRKVFRNDHYDIVLNLFTSFGYFREKEENLKSFKAMTASLKPGGLLILDYLNSKKLLMEIEQESTMKCNISGIDFFTKKYIDDGYIMKEIVVREKGIEHNFVERVKLIPKERFDDFARESGLKVLHYYGDYHLSEYKPETSERMILIATKK